MMRDGILSRPTEYLLHLRKFSHGRQSTSAICTNIVTADKVFPRKDGVLRRPTEFSMLQDGVLSRPSEYAMRRDGVLQRPTKYHLQLRKYSHGRQSTSAICANIVTADKVFPQKDGVLRWPTEYTMLYDRVLQRPSEYLLRWKKHYNGRQSTYFKFTVSSGLIYSIILQYHLLYLQYHPDS